MRRAEPTSKQGAAQAGKAALVGSQGDLCLHRTAEITVAYVSRNKVRPSDLPRLIEATYRELSKIAATDRRGSAAVAAGRSAPAVPIPLSVSPDFVICLEDGKPFKSLRRHLKARFDMTPDDYRQKWGLPADYPMLAPNYAVQRVELAKKIALERLAKRQRKL